MAPITTRRGVINSQQHVPSEEDASSHHYNELYFLIDVHGQEMQECTDRLKTHLKHVGDDVLSHHIEELYFLIDVHAQEMQECTERLKTDLGHVVVKMQMRSQQGIAAEGSSQVLATTVQPQILSCLNCKTLPATMIIRLPTYVKHKRAYGSAYESGAPHNTTLAIGSQQHLPSEDDGLSHNYEELCFLIDVHAQEMQECTDILKTEFKHVRVEMQRSLQELATGEGSSQGPATRVQPQLFTCLNCKVLPATMVCYPCRHLCICLECDTKVSICLMCNNIKQSSFMANLSA
ncbi:hypothetical protein L1987_71177 [Smallanthus sonchifolius]|uniref:Uncharacterized protein n=1 Tax=Smallanthus sonchifolius TaxID=185202 RepID=A0ACB9ARY0_9ASTR|nr:hypothetical protein L1987_71177 [Smallanthus sonchifolius]